ncbi:protein broad-minded [Erpetoichthys calabaricus]|uniref:Protein broad-minded n=1 Tax=Erpetoichthys calabaricus TaxID=27687 RepID=A0A8C4X3T7_ERPCA|nr:protein broad-minded [Erpetoichthys calabaricus]
MSQFTADDEAELQSLLRQLLKSVKERIASAPSVECAEEILLHLEETDDNFHNYEFVRYLRCYIDNALGSVIEGETELCSNIEGQIVSSGQDTLVQAVTRKTRESIEYKTMIQSLKNTMMIVVESLINKFEEDLMRKEEMHRKSQSEHHSSHYTDNCSDSDSSFNQSYTFIKQEQLQIITEKLDPSQNREVRWEALQTLCSAPSSDVLNCESWGSLRKNLSAALADSDSAMSEKVLRFYAKTFSSSPLNITKEIYTSLAKHLESDFLNKKMHFIKVTAGVDICHQDVIRLLKKVRLLNEFQKEVSSFWIRHPEKYMEEIIESTLSLLSVTNEQSLRARGSEKTLELVHFQALLDIKATWFKKWMHGCYSRTVVLRLLENKYKSLIVAALQQCTDYLETCKSKADDNPFVGNITHGKSNTTVYTGKELQFINLVHSLCLLGRLLMYTQGRKLFPVKLRNRKESVCLTDLIVMLIQIMYVQPKSAFSGLSHTDFLSPVSLVMEVLRSLCDQKECAVECLHATTVVEALISPIASLLFRKQLPLNCVDSTLTHIADILARIATTDQGLLLFLYDENVISADGKRMSAAHVIVQFTQKLLIEDVPALSECETLSAIKGAFIFVCRQMYNTCEGLEVLKPYGLHNCIAEAWKKESFLSERVPTPLPGTMGYTTSQDLQNNMIWEETLLDNLLNFAATPKGLLLLQQTGAINECVSYMFNRFTKKLQVSRCEKFGYGVMVTQVAAIAPGVVALQSSGFVKAIVLELWSVLECGRDDVRIAYPKSTPMDPIDRSCQKSFLALVNLLSSYHAVYELIGKQPLPNKPEYPLREMPTSIIDVIDRLIVMNSEAKMHSLFNFEQSHTLGLRLLNILCCNLDTLLLLESLYSISEIMLNAQKENVAESSEKEGLFIIDGLSVERNHILVRINVVGGSSERFLPPRTLQEGSDPYPWPMFSSYPVPKCYIKEVPKKTLKQDNDVSKFLSSSRTSEKHSNWLDNCRRVFFKTMTTKPELLKINVLADVLERFVMNLSSNASECFFTSTDYKGSDSSVKNQTLSAVELLGIKMSIRYGKTLNLIKEDSEQDLCLLMKHSQKFLLQQKVKLCSPLCYLQESYPGHDWFVSSVFLIMAGDKVRALKFLLRLSELLVSAFLWLPRLHASSHLPLETAESGIHPVYFYTAHYVEMLLMKEVPLVFSAFRMSGFTPSQICLQWLSQCFWNYLDWPEICHYIAACVVLGPDYQVYFCIALLKHLQQEILQHTQAQDLQVFLKEEAIHNFQMSDYLEYMSYLEQKYRPVVMKDMRNIKQQNT